MDDLFESGLTYRELKGLDKQAHNIRGGLKIATAKKIQNEQHINREKDKLAEMENDSSYTNEQKNKVKERLRELNDELKVHEEHIELLKGELKYQIESIKETISKVLNSDTTLGEKISTLFREQRITIASILTLPLEWRSVY